LVGVAAADVLCQDLRRRLTGERPGDCYFRDVSWLAEAIIGGEFEALTGVREAAILMPYES
jgi:hypothetical protein